MAQQTQSYNRSLAGSLGAGMGSLFGGTGKHYYILEHKITTKYHKAGETQEIIIDQIELGRDPKCQVRFDEAFGTVSRRHAAIVKAGENWKLVQLSQTNSTFLNGKKIEKEWYLQSGDEIQLSVNGPKLGFIIPTGKKATVGSIGLSRRLNLFRQQALRPYKQAITALSIVLLLAIGGGFGWNYRQYIAFEKRINVLVAQTDSLITKDDSLQQVITSIQNRPRQAAPTPVPIPPAIETLLEMCKNDIYYLTATEVYLTDGNRKVPILTESGTPYGWSATGFLLNDGRFVTARHCVQAWRFEADAQVISAAAQADSSPDIEIVAVIKAISRNGRELAFKSSDFTFDDRYDGKRELGTFEDGMPAHVLSVLFSNDERAFSTDWAYARTTERGDLPMNQPLSDTLLAGTELHVLGFPRRIGVGDTPSRVNPTYNRFAVGFDGLDNSGCFLHTRGIDHGNSGGPILVKQGNILTVIGIVSRGSTQSEEYGYGVPISAIH
ncbi:MAG: FHA domain-containing protein [Odoribacteraceae bacterium]|jgi:hypothetical protein|nr:FHA domain-containing protein [Odoribacteraceae bacterium]